MDPTFRHSVALYLNSLDVDHWPVDEEEATRRASLRLPPIPIGWCRCGDQMIDGRDRHLLEVITLHFAEPKLKPHAVHVEPTFEDEDRGTFDATGKFKPKIVKVRRQVEDSCPDCGRGLVSRGHDMICSRLSREIDLKGDHEGCIVACGWED